MRTLLVALGGAAGALARYWVGLAVHSTLGSTLPWGTFSVNISGSFIVGFVMTVLANRITSGANWHFLLVTGFLGAYTTFSALEYETLSLFQQQRAPAALGYVVLSLVVGLAAVWLGTITAR